jgi:predicted MFS family arabinose efflux permease
VKGLSLVSFFNDISSEMIYPLLPAFLLRYVGASATLLGALDGAAQFTSACLNWVSGRLSDRPGLRKPLILIGYGTAVLVRPLIAIATAGWQVMGFRVLDRVGKGLRTAPRDAYIAESTPPEMLGRAFGFHRAADHLGAMLGALIGGWALSRVMDIRKVISWSAVPGIVAVVVLAVVLKGQVASTELRVQSQGPESAPPALATRNSQLSLPILLLALFTLARLPELLLLNRLSELGVPDAGLPLAWAGLHVVRSSASYPAGRLHDRIGADLMIGAGAALFAFCLCLLGKPLPAAWAVAVFLLFGLFAALTEPAERALVAKLSPKKLGKGFGMYHALTGLAALPAGIGFGMVYENGGGSDALWLSGALVGVAGVVWIGLRSRSETGGDVAS